MYVTQLIVGDFGLSTTQAKAQFAVWSIFASVSFFGHSVNDITMSY